MMNMQKRNEKEKRALSKKKEKRITHYSSNHQILLVGEGDFSFSLSLANAFGSASNICATTLDSYDDLIKKYKRAKSNVENLEKLGATLLYKVDATKMNSHTDLMKRKFDRIIFNFPHGGFHAKEDDVFLIMMHRTIVRDFFGSARGMLLINGEVHVSHKITAPFCYWNLEELAYINSLVLVECVDFKRKDYPGYCNKRGGGSRCDEAFPLGKCSTYKFRFCHAAKEPRNFQNINVQRQLQPTFSNLNYPQRNLIMNHIHMPLYVGQPSCTPEFNNYYRGCVDFKRGDYPGYCNKRGGGSRCDEAFPLGKCSTYKFRFCHAAKEPRNFQNINMQRQLQPTFSDLNYLQRNLIMNHIHMPLYVGQPSCTPELNNYYRGFYTSLSSLPERMYSNFDVEGEVRNDLPRQTFGNLNYPSEVLRLNNLRSHYNYMGWRS